MTDKSISFIVPCYNEANRLKNAETDFIEFIQLNPSIKCKIIFVNDGSTDNTENALSELCLKINLNTPKTASLVSYKNNKGKGWALQEGIANATTDWCLTIDVDMAARPHELISWIDKFKIDLELDDHIFIGSREKGIDDHIVKSSLLRRNIGLLFNLILKSLTGLKFRDTQCGFKLYPTSVAKNGFDNLTDYGFAHDVEVLLKLKSQGIQINTLTLHWEEKPGSKVNLVSDSLKMLSTVIKIRNKYR
jgi:dolichyl-phosphate beta-glucosyltransferase